MVGWALHAMDKQPYPWQRVINSRGIISTTCETYTRELQKHLLESEGIEVTSQDGEYRIDLKKYLWRPKIK
jgi:alkylated DNA nucleotide flippase Atl1